MKTEREILQAKIEAKIGSNYQKTQDMYNRIMVEAHMLNDYVVPLRQMDFKVEEKGLDVEYGYGLKSVNKHSLEQLGGRFGIPVSYINKLFGTQWGRELLMVALNTHKSNEERERLLLREVNGVVRGVLSDTYKRLDSVKLLSSFLTGAQKYGAVPVDAYVDETRTFLEVIIPEVREMRTDKNGILYYVAGARLKNSDFGDGRVDGRFFITNVECLNGMTGERLMGEVHRGKRLENDIRLSDRTMRLDTATTASKLRDMIEYVFNPETIEFKMEKVYRATTKEINVKEEVKRLPKLGFSKEETKDVEEVLLQNRPEHGLKGDKTIWSFTQALTAMAQFEKVGELRKREIEKVAGEMVFGRGVA